MNNALISFLSAVNIGNYQSIRKTSIGETLSYVDIIQLSLINQRNDITIGTLGKVLNLSKPATTQKVNELVARGLIEKIHSVEDKRVVYLKFTDSFAKFCKETIISDLTAEVEKTFSESEKESFYTILEFMTEYLKNLQNTNAVVNT